MIWIDHVTVSLQSFLVQTIVDFVARLNALPASTSFSESLLLAESQFPTATSTDRLPGQPPAMDATTGLFTSPGPTT